MKTENKQEITSIEQLKDRGWRVTWAAAKIGRSVNHVSLVLRGLRTSKTVTRKLSALPQQEPIKY